MSWKEGIVLEAIGSQFARGVFQLVRTPACHVRGRGFEFGRPLSPAGPSTNLKDSR
jgi:hypothetical protein